MSTNKYYTIRKKTDGTFAVLDSTKNIMYSAIENCSQWTTRQEVQNIFNIYFKIHNVFEIVEVHEKSEYTYNVIASNKELLDILSTLTSEQIAVLSEAGLVIPDDEKSIEEKYNNYKEHSTWLEFPSCSVNVGSLFYFMKNTISSEARQFPELELFVSGNDSFAKELASLFWHVDNEGDIRVVHPTLDWDYWNFPKNLSQTIGIMEELENQYNDDSGIWSEAW